MSGLAHFGLIALLPAALNVTAASASTIAMPVCTGEGVVRTVEVPLKDPNRAPEPCCAKGCHGGSSRKKSDREFAPAQ